MQSCESSRRLHFLSTILFYLAFTIFKLPSQKVIASSSDICVSNIGTSLTDTSLSFISSPKDLSPNLNMVLPHYKTISCGPIFLSFSSSKTIANPCSISNLKLHIIATIRFLLLGTEIVFGITYLKILSTLSTHTSLRPFLTIKF